MASVSHQFTLLLSEKSCKGEMEVTSVTGVWSACQVIMMGAKSQY